MYIIYYYLQDYVFYYKVTTSSDNEDNDDNELHIDNYNLALTKYVKYFEKTWLGETNPRTGVRGRPVFGMSFW